MGSTPRAYRLKASNACLSFSTFSGATPVFTLFGGLAIVLLHNYWSGGALTVIITLLGWLTLIKAVLLLVLPSTRLVALYGGVSPTYILLSGSLTLLLGIYLTVAGFRSPLDKSEY